ncbi:HK97 family phage prohead protease [Phenylobacterium sp.]|uniref:HK97 family phage prohead protease n=1 Tax=Phenylobacterium sp. TaxID=1871053 RepID=UPI0019BDB2F4|nr:HK97 family phage prohead protease [Phenylobacterium sp.]MBC7168321.1 HK97 family phage prohead protease [Phenylobacterium sp.]
MPMISIDEFLNDRKDYVKSGDVLVKAAKAPASWNEEARTARFVMSTEQEDRDRDIIMQAGLETDGFMKNPVAPFTHRSWDFPIGSWSNVEKMLSGRPKRTEGDLTVLPEGTDANADRVARHIAAGSIRACSIGFIPKAVERREVPEDKRDSYFYPGYIIHESELVECSPCLIPANPGAMAKAGADGDVIAREILEEVLDTWAKHPETGLLIPRAEFEAAWKEATGHRQVVTFSPQAEAGFFEKLSSHLGKIIGKEPKAPEPATADPVAQKAAADRAKALSERMAAKNLAA